MDVALGRPLGRRGVAVGEFYFSSFTWAEVATDEWAWVSGPFGSIYARSYPHFLEQLRRHCATTMVIYAWELAGGEWRYLGNVYPQLCPGRGLGRV